MCSKQLSLVSLTDNNKTDEKGCSIIFFFSALFKNSSEMNRKDHRDKENKWKRERESEWKSNNVISCSALGMEVCFDVESKVRQS